MTQPDRPETPMNTTTTTLTADGFIPVPADFLRAAGLNPGDRLVLECDGYSILVRPLERPETWWRKPSGE